MENLDEVQIWINRYSSEKAKKRYMKFLKFYCAFHGKTPTELLEIKRDQKDHVSEKMLDLFVLKWDKPESTKESAVSAIRSFYSANYLDLAKRAGGGTKYRRIKPYRNPTQAQLRDMCAGSHTRGIALINVLSSGGFRAETLRILSWGHVAEIGSCGKTEPIHVPIMGKELKGGGAGKYRGLEQHAFLTPHAVGALLKYRAWREARGEKITQASPLFATINRNPTRLKDTRHLRHILASACESKPFFFSAHDLRRFTQTQLEQARVQPNWIRKMLGKKVPGDEAPYSLPKIEQLRDAYRLAIPFLTLAEIGASLDMLESRKSALLDIMGFILYEKPDMLGAFENMLEKVSVESELNDFMIAWRIRLINGKVYPL